MAMAVYMEAPPTILRAIQSLAFLTLGSSTTLLIYQALNDLNPSGIHSAVFSPKFNTLNCISTVNATENPGEAMGSSACGVIGLFSLLKDIRGQNLQKTRGMGQRSREK